MTNNTPFEPNTEPLRFFVDPAAVVWLGGEAPLDYLQRMSTNKLVDLETGKGRYTVLTSDSGRAIDLLACYRGAAGVALITSSPNAAPGIAQHLRRYVLFGDEVTVTDASEQVGLIRLVGADALSVARSITGIQATLAEPGSWLETGEGDDTVWLLRHLEPGLGGIDLVTPRGAPHDRLVSRLHDEGTPRGEASDMDRLRVLAGLPAHGAEIDGQTNPLELGLLDQIDFDKGCYVGQEVIARLANYEKIQRRLVRLRSERAMVAGAELRPKTGAEEGRRPRPGYIKTVMARQERWFALALVPLATRAGDMLYVVEGDSDVTGSKDAHGIEVVAEIGRMPG